MAFGTFWAVCENWLLSFSQFCVLHKNIPGIINKITSVISSNNSNIANFINKSRGEYAYSVFDVDGEVDTKAIANLDDIIRVRVI